MDLGISVLKAFKFILTVLGVFGWFTKFPFKLPWATWDGENFHKEDAWASGCVRSR